MFALLLFIDANYIEVPCMYAVSTAIYWGLKLVIGSKPYIFHEIYQIRITKMPSHNYLCGQVLDFFLFVSTYVWL